MSKHVTAASKFLESMAPVAPDDDDRKLQLAQVHASLALAEQQRIANLIAYAATNGPAISIHSRALSAIQDGLGL